MEEARRLKAEGTAAFTSGLWLEAQVWERGAHQPWDRD